MELLFDDFNLASTGFNDPDLALLDYYAQQGFVFLTSTQARAVLKKTYGQLRYLTLNYALDAYAICGKYRYTIQALKDCIDNKQGLFEQAYHNAMLKRELSGIHALAFRGSITEALYSIQVHGYPVTAIDDLVAKTEKYYYDEMDEGSTELEDFYDIPSLPIPEKIYLGDLAAMFQVSPVDLAKEMQVSSDALLSYPEVYDYLVVKQLLNMNIPVLIDTSDKISKDDGQLFLF